MKIICYTGLCWNPQGLIGLIFKDIWGSKGGGRGQNFSGDFCQNLMKTKKIADAFCVGFKN